MISEFLNLKVNQTFRELVGTQTHGERLKATETRENLLKLEKQPSRRAQPVAM